MPGEARAEAALSTRVMTELALHGFERVALPAFEYESVLERGLGELEPEEVLRFVEPESGEVVALRPDMTPQIARLVSTRLADRVLPIRLAYQGSVLRRRRERARRNRQIPQAGAELVGADGARGDLEVLSVAAATVRAAGLVEYGFDLSHAHIAAPLVASAPEAERAGLLQALSHKDAEALARRAARAGLADADRRALLALPELHGEGEVFERAEAVLAGTACLPAVRALGELYRAAQAADLAPQLTVDLGEVWNFAYYTGPMFQVLARGPGEAIGSGGRYDGLYQRFGQPWSAAGFALDLDHLAWALRDAGVAEPVVARVVVAAGPSAEAVAAVLRGLGVAAVVHADAERYARSAEFTHWLAPHSGGLGLCARGGPVAAIDGRSAEEIASAVAARLT